MQILFEMEKKLFTQVFNVNRENLSVRQIWIISMFFQNRMATGEIFGLKFLEKILILDFRIGSFAFGQNSTISCISSSQESDLLFIGIDYPSGGGGEIVIFNPFLSIRLKRIRNVF